MKSSDRLGKGLEAIFGSKFNLENNKIETILLSEIKKAPWQPRKEFDELALNELAISIKRHGVLQPILLKKIENGYELVAGERRFKASQIAELSFIPAIVIDNNEQMLLEISMIENLQRVDLNTLEKAQGFLFLIEKLKVSQEELANRLGVNRSVIANYLRINNLPEEIKEKILTNKLSFGHAKMLVNKSNATEIANEIVEKKLSVREVEKKLSKNKSSSNNKNNAEVKNLESLLKQELNTNVNIEMEKNNGKLIIDFSDLDELEKIISKICDL